MTKNKAKVISSSICGILILLCVLVYLILGVAGGLWHPWWIIIICGLVLAGITDSLTNMIVELKKKDENEDKKE